MGKRQTTESSIACNYSTQTVSTNTKPHTPRNTQTASTSCCIYAHKVQTKYKQWKPRSPDYGNRNTRPNKLSQPQFPHRPPTYLDGSALSTSLNSSGTSRGFTQILLVRFDFQKTGSDLFEFSRNWKVFAYIHLISRGSRSS